VLASLKISGDILHSVLKVCSTFA